MSVEEDIKRVAEHERVLVFRSFTEDTAREIGESIRQAAAADGAALVIGVRFWNRVLYHFAMPGTGPSQADWVRRKSNFVERFHMASYAMTLRQQRDGKGFAHDDNVDPTQIAAHGGSFPIRIEGVAGVIGTITVSGVPGRRDHGYVAAAIAKHLGIDYTPLALPAE
jgi:uncharacterized protein (UPF0303 family)